MIVDEIGFQGLEIKKKRKLRIMTDMILTTNMDIRDQLAGFAVVPDDVFGSELSSDGPESHQIENSHSTKFKEKEQELEVFEVNEPSVTPSEVKNLKNHPTQASEQTFFRTKFRLFRIIQCAGKPARLIAWSPKSIKVYSVDLQEAKKIKFLSSYTPELETTLNEKIAKLEYREAARILQVTISGKKSQNKRILFLDLNPQSGALTLSFKLPSNSQEVYPGPERLLRPPQILKTTQFLRHIKQAQFEDRELIEANFIALKDPARLKHAPEAYMQVIDPSSLERNFYRDRMLRNKSGYIPVVKSAAQARKIDKKVEKWFRNIRLDFGSPGDWEVLSLANYNSRGALGTRIVPILFISTTESTAYIVVVFDPRRRRVLRTSMFRASKLLKLPSVSLLSPKSSRYSPENGLKLSSTNFAYNLKNDLLAIDVELKGGLEPICVGMGVVSSYSKGYRGSVKEVAFVAGSSVLGQLEGFVASWFDFESFESGRGDFRRFESTEKKSFSGDFVGERSGKMGGSGCPELANWGFSEKFEQICLKKFFGEKSISLLRVGSEGVLGIDGRLCLASEQIGDVVSLSGSNFDIFLTKNSICLFDRFKGVVLDQEHVSLRLDHLDPQKVAYGGFGYLCFGFDSKIAIFKKSQNEDPEAAWSSMRSIGELETGSGIKFTKFEHFRALQTPQKGKENQADSSPRIDPNTTFELVFDAGDCLVALKITTNIEISTKKYFKKRVKKKRLIGTSTTLHHHSEAKYSDWTVLGASKTSLRVLSKKNPNFKNRQKVVINHQKMDTKGTSGGNRPQKFISRLNLVYFNPSNSQISLEAFDLKTFDYSFKTSTKAPPPKQETKRVFTRAFITKNELIFIEKVNFTEISKNRKTTDFLFSGFKIQKFDNNTLIFDRRVSLFRGDKRRLVISKNFMSCFDFSSFGLFSFSEGSLAFRSSPKAFHVLEGAKNLPEFDKFEPIDGRFVLYRKRFFAGKKWRSVSLKGVSGLGGIAKLVNSQGKVSRGRKVTEQVFYDLEADCKVRGLLEAEGEKDCVIPISDAPGKYLWFRKGEIGVVGLQNLG